MSLLISTVLSGSRNRLAPLPELPCTMPGIAVAVLGADDQHVAAVAVGHDLLLQVFRRVLAAQVRFERAAKPRPLLAQPIANAPQLRARIVHHLAGRDRSCGGRRRFRARTTPRASAIARKARERASRAPDPRRTWRRPRRERRERRADAAASSARPSTASDSRIASRSAGACSAMLVVAERSGRSRTLRRARAETARGVASAAAAARAAQRPAGVSAKRRTASTIRSNSRALRAPACIGRGLGVSAPGDRAILNYIA